MFHGVDVTTKVLFGKSDHHYLVNTIWQSFREVEVEFGITCGRVSVLLNGLALLLPCIFTVEDSINIYIMWRIHIHLTGPLLDEQKLMKSWTGITCFHSRVYMYMCMYVVYRAQCLT